MWPRPALLSGSGRPPIVDSLSAEVASCLGLPAVRLVPAPVGGAAHLCFHVLRPSGGEAPVAFLRVEGGFAGRRYGLRREAVVLPVCAAMGLPVAQVLGTPGDPPGLLMEVVPGTSRPSPEEVEAVAPEYLALVSRLHAADPCAFPVEQFATVYEAVTEDLHWWERYAEETGAMEEAIVRLGGQVLRTTIPKVTAAPVLLHGDVGAGNFMVQDGRLTAMLDWELAHVGDAHEDLAWLWMRGAHTSFGDPGRRLSEYASAAGRSIVPDRLRWHLAFVMWKSCVGMYANLRRPSTEPSIVQSLVILTYDALLGCQLLRLLGGSIQLLSQKPVVRVTPATPLADRILETGELTKADRIAVAYLRDSAAQSGWERDELAEDLYRAGLPSHARLVESIDGTDRQRLLALTTVVARACDRSAMALPNAVRRIQRAQAIGLGTIDDPIEEQL
jgi:aminoglycoside phosphotransferase